MDYDKFKKEYESFDSYMENFKQTFDCLDGYPTDKGDYVTDFAQSGENMDQLVIDDRVNSPSHYTSGRLEVIDIIEDAIKDSPEPTVGMLQAQVLKYLLRLWLKDNPTEDAKKARWYLDRLIVKLHSAR